MDKKDFENKIIDLVDSTINELYYQSDANPTKEYFLDSMKNVLIDLKENLLEELNNYNPNQPNDKD